MGVTALDRDQDTAPSTSDLDQATTGAASGDIPFWLTDGTRWNMTASTSYMRGLLSSASEATLKAAINAEAGVDFVGYGGALGAPSSGTLTNCTGLPMAGVSDLHSSWRPPLALDLAEMTTLHVLRGAENVISFDADWTGVASSHDAYGETLTQLNSDGEGVIEFKPNSIVQLVPTYGATALPSLTGLRNVHFRFRGSKLVSPATMTTGQTYFVHTFSDDNEGVFIDDVRVEWENYLTPDLANATGLWWFHFYDSGKNLTINSIRALGGANVVNFGRGATTTKRWENIKIGLIEATNCGRALRCADNGDNVVFDLIRAEKCGRPMLAQNWHGLIKGNVVERNSYTQISIVNHTTGSATYNGDPTSGDLDLNHIGLAPTASGLGEAYRVSFEQRGTDPGTWGNWKLRSRTYLDISGGTSQGILTIRKTTSDGVLDATADRSHSGSFKLDLEADGAPASGTVALLMADSGSVGDWSGENGVEMDAAIRVRGSASASSQVKALAQVSAGPRVKLEADLDGTLSRSGTPAAGYWERSQDAAGKRIYNGASTLGTAANQNTGTSGATVPLLNGANTHSGGNSFTGGTENFLSSGGALTINFRGDTGATNTIERSGSNSGSPVKQFYKSRGTYASRSNVAQNDQLGQLGFSGYADSGFRSGATIVANVLAATPSSTDMETEIVVAVSGSGSVSPSNRLRIKAATVRPGADNTQSCGDGSLRWSEIFAGTGTINTSDAREKTKLRCLSDAEKRAIRTILGGIGVYQWLSSVERKGDDARLHVGVTAQAVEQAFSDEGLDARRYALFCVDPLFETVEIEPARYEHREVKGQVVDIMVPAVTEERAVIDPETGAQKVRFGVRHDQIFAMALGLIAETILK